MLRRLRLENFRCFSDHTVEFQPATVIVGKNNAGKSTIVEALHLVAAVVNRKAATFTTAPPSLGLGRFQRVIAPKISHLRLNLSTAFHRYGEPPAVITASFDDGVVITIYLGREDTVHATIERRKEPVTTTGQFAALDIPYLFLLPQVGPLLSEEDLRTDGYIAEHLYTRLSSRHFRNQIFRAPDSFADFQLLAESTWHGLRVQPLERSDTRLSLLIQDGDFVAEVGWMGHGLQMWLQTIWFVSRTPRNASVVLDEPDVYMHPDLQRKLFRLLRNRFPQIMIATHSVEIMAEADPSQILIVDKTKRRSTYANSQPAVQLLVDQLGGIHNVHLARLWSAKKVLLLEGKDLDFLRLFHGLLFPNADTTLDSIPNLSIGGWGGWAQAIGSAKALKNAVGDRITTYCILDSDYHTNGEKTGRYQQAGDHGINLRIWQEKEIENYLLNPNVVTRLIKARLQKGTAPTPTQVQEEILRICEAEKDTVLDGVAAGIMAEDKKLGAGANKRAREYLLPLWQEPAQRVRLVSGKQVVSQLSAWAQEQYGVSFGAIGLARMFRKSEVPEEIAKVLLAIENGAPFEL